MQEFTYLLIGGVVGAAIQYVFPYFVGFPRYVWLHRKYKRAAEGIWYSYHFTRKNHQVQTVSTRWRIRRNYRGKLSVKGWRSGTFAMGSGSIQCKGSAFTEEGFLVISVQATRYEAHWSIRVNNPIPTDEHFVSGLWLSYDFDGDLTAGPIIFSRETMDFREAELLLKEGTTVSPPYKLLRAR
jgi:hypothetical protein